MDQHIEVVADERDRGRPEHIAAAERRSLRGGESVNNRVSLARRVDPGNAAGVTSGKGPDRGRYLGTEPLRGTRAAPTRLRDVEVAIGRELEPTWVVETGRKDCDIGRESGVLLRRDPSG